MTTQGLRERSSHAKRTPGLDAFDEEVERVLGLDDAQGSCRTQAYLDGGILVDQASQRTGPYCFCRDA